MLAKSSDNNRFSRDRNMYARIDGFTIKSADTGGGITVNGYGAYLEISNNRISNNTGFYGGGIRVGHPALTNELAGALAYTDAENDFVNVHHNQVVFNGGQGGAGGGISMCTGSDAYQVTQNWVCGNFSARDGGGIGHIGRSDGIWTTVPNSGLQALRVWTLTEMPQIWRARCVVCNARDSSDRRVQRTVRLLASRVSLPICPYRHILHPNEPDGQAPGLASRIGQDTTPFPAGQDRSGRSALEVAAGRVAGDAAFEADASDCVCCHELRISDTNVTWRIVYRIDPDGIGIVDVFSKKTTATPAAVIEACRRRLREYDDA